MSQGRARDATNGPIINRTGLEAFEAATARHLSPGAKGARVLGVPFRPRCAISTRRTRAGRDWPPYAGVRAGHARHNTPPARRPGHRTWREPGMSRAELRYDEISSRRCRKNAPHFFKSPAPSAGARSRAADGHSLARSVPAKPPRRSNTQASFPAPPGAYQGVPHFAGGSNTGNPL
jgi:hypothetical protein